MSRDFFAVSRLPGRFRLVRSCGFGGVRSGGRDDECARGDAFEALRLWQEEPRCMLVIVEGPHSGPAASLAGSSPASVSVLGVGERGPVAPGVRPRQRLRPPSVGAALRVTAPHPAARGPAGRDPGSESRDRELEVLNCDVYTASHEI